MRVGGVRPVVLDQISGALFICAAVVFQIKMFAPDIGYGVIALLLAGAYLTKAPVR